MPLLNLFLSFTSFQRQYYAVKSRLTILHGYYAAVNTGHKACSSIVQAKLEIHIFNGFSLFSSPEHEVLMMSYCDQSLSVVRALSTFCFKRLLLQNGLTDFEIILQEGSLGDPLPKLLKPFRSAEQDGHQS